MATPNAMLLPCALVIAFAAFTHAQRPDTAGEAHERVFPWIAHSSVDAFYLASPVSGSREQPYQVSLYQGFTIQSLTFAWFHAGLRSRETLAPGFRGAYREPASVKLGMGAEVLRDYVFVSLGGNIPIFSGQAQSGDSLAFYQAMNGYNPMPYSAFLSPRAMHAGLFGRYGWANWTVLAGLSYSRPALFRLYAEKGFFPAAYFDGVFRAICQTGAARHRWDAKGTFYGREDTDLRIPAHDEGDLWQLRYGYAKSVRRVGWQAGLGLAAKLPDANRRLKQDAELVVPDRDENLQRVYGEFAIAWAPRPGILWRIHVLPKALFDLGGRIGHEAESGLSLGMKAWEAHRVRVAGTFLYGAVDHRDYVGFGIRAEFAFRHLGFQDADETAGDGQAE